MGRRDHRTYWLNLGWWQIQFSKDELNIYRTDYFHIGAGIEPAEGESSHDPS